MIVIISAILGALIGGGTAYRRKGRPADIAQYAAGFGIAFALVGVFATIIIGRLVM